MKKCYLFFIILLLTACVSGKGQVVFHWDRYNTGGIKFARDHSECMRQAEAFRLFPSIKSWFYSEEQRYDTVVKWHKEKGIWASFVPYPGAAPVLVNSVRDDTDVSPRKYKKCMLKKGYITRTKEIPETSNLFIYKPQSVNQGTPLDDTYNY
ncbi:MAG: hypothetical protein IJE43_17570 [Alphaproteobacteria bacterium]|nr:hypothetical protein [Alphaproteobacteria bacterium]